MIEKLCKLRKQDGFTLMEMLIVVAIIAILAAIAIPVFTTQLENTRKGVDDANMRSAKSAATSIAMSGEGAGAYMFAYDKTSGNLTYVTTAPVKTAGYNQNAIVAADNGGNSVAAGEGYIEVTIDANYAVTQAIWVTGT